MKVGMIVTGTDLEVYFKGKVPVEYDPNATYQVVLVNGTKQLKEIH